MKQESKSGIRTGLVLEGGAMRGLFTAGVMDTLLRAGVVVDGVVGVSAGAAFGCNFVSQQPGRVLRYNKLMAHDRRFCSIWSWMTTGNLFGADFNFHYLPNHIDRFDAERFSANPAEFHLVATDVDTGLPVYRRIDRIGYEAEEWFRASASMPMAATIVNIGGRRLLDGGIADSIPLRYFEREGFGRNIVVLTRPAGYTKGRDRTLPLMRLWLRRHPGLVRALERRPEMYNSQLRYVAEAESEGCAFVIRPPLPLPIGHICHDPDTMQRVYDIGVEVAKEKLSALESFLGLPVNLR